MSTAMCIGRKGVDMGAGGSSPKIDYKQMYEEVERTIQSATRERNLAIAETQAEIARMQSRSAAKGEKFKTYKNLLNRRTEKAQKAYEDVLADIKKSQTYEYAVKGLTRDLPYSEYYTTPSQVIYSQKLAEWEQKKKQIQSQWASKYPTPYNVIRGKDKAEWQKQMAEIEAMRPELEDIQAEIKTVTGDIDLDALLEMGEAKYGKISQNIDKLSKQEQAEAQAAWAAGGRRGIAPERFKQLQQAKRKKQINPLATTTSELAANPWV